MKAEEHDGLARDVSCSEARAELERLLADERFRATERSRSILRYIVEQQFAGHGDGVKAYSIAIDVLGRQSNFDPSLDPIVRIELSRLRSSLSQYYEAFGKDDGVAVQLPRGRYVAVFIRGGGTQVDDRDHPTAVDDAPILVREQARSTGAPGVQPRSRATLWFVSAIGLLVGVAIAGSIYASRPVTTAKPTVIVTMTAADEALRGEASVTRDMLLTALTQFQTLTVSQGDRRERPLASVLRPAKSNDYAIDMKYYGDGDDRSIWWQIVDSSTGDLLKSGLEKVDTSGRTALAVRDELVAQLARRFAATRGVINNIETHDAAEGSLGNACVLRAEYELDDGQTSGIARTISCLERTVAANRHDADATAALSTVLATGQAEVADDVKIGRALELANRAVALAPLSDRAHIALMLSQFYSGRTDAAIAAGNRALALNPGSPDVAARLGLVLFSSGYFDAGASLARDASSFADVVPRDAMLVLALDAYRRKDWSGALLLAEQASGSNFLIGVLRVAALGQLGSDEASPRLAELRLLAPALEARFRQAMAQQHYEPILSGSIEDGLTKAGAHFTAEGVATAF